MILDHLPGKLSKLEQQMEKHIPIGGNWEDIPVSIPSQRLAQIRESSRIRGKCRTTYYGRLHPKQPSYTINTYFGRLGNGTFLHYDRTQHRLITLREGARIQSFPDDYRFEGTYTSKFKQIGNAVPPFLAFTIARGRFNNYKALDLFSGCGGLSLGLEWAGVTVVCANDISKHEMSTFKENHKNVHTILGDIREKTTKEEIINNSDGVDLIVGGPPCQGFSQAGWFNPEDDRNKLFREFLDIITEIKPKVFLMENVQGLLWIDKRRAIKTMLNAFQEIGYKINHFVLSSELYAIPQIRKRVFILGTIDNISLDAPPELLTKDSKLIMVGEALSDLPAIINGKSSSDSYIKPPSNLYQRFIRKKITPNEYYEHFSKRNPKGKPLLHYLS